MISTEELLSAMRSGTIMQINCPDCHATGSKFNGIGKSSQCPRCKGRRKLISIPRSPVTLPMTDEWKFFLSDKEEASSRSHKAKGK
jgi:DnaJ-class molecular chaperone